jgi:uncharacterized protein involved in exopolysaccharide biosynthesis
MNELGIGRLRAVFRRRRIAIIATMVGVLGVGAAVLTQIEPAYKAGAIIRVGEVQPAKEYVAPTVAEQMGERLKSLRLAVMSRPIVTEAARQLELGKLQPKKPLDEIVDELRLRMDVKLEGEDTFLLTYSDSNPERARALVNKIGELFIKQHVERRAEIASATAQAIEAEVDTLQPKLTEADEAVRKFKLEHYGALPEQMEGNLRNLDQTTMEINIQSTNLDLDEERRRQLLAAALSPLRHHEETLAALVYDARTKYTDENPEVLRIRAEYERVRAQRIADERDLLQKVRRQNPELAALDGQIGREKAILSGLRQRQGEVRKRVEATAKNGHDLAALSLVYDGLKEKYSAALGHLRDAELAQGIERSLASLRVDLVEGAALPSRASSNRPLFALGTVVLALALGFGVGFAIDATDRSLREPADLRLLVPSTPVLACVPHTPFHKPTSTKPEA